MRESLDSLRKRLASPSMASPIKKRPSQERPKFKCTLVGAPGIGKSSLVRNFIHRDSASDAYFPTTIESYDTVVKLDKCDIHLDLSDTGGKDEFDQLRPLSYPKTDVFILCYAIDSMSSFAEVTERWLPEIRHYNPGAPIILVATKTDLRHSQSKGEQKILEQDIVRQADGKALLKQQQLSDYLEFSSLNPGSASSIFETAVRLAMKRRKNLKEPRGSKITHYMKGCLGVLSH